MQNAVNQRNNNKIKILSSAFSYLFLFGNWIANDLVTETSLQFSLFLSFVPVTFDDNHHIIRTLNIYSFTLAVTCFSCFISCCQAHIRHVTSGKRCRNLYHFETVGSQASIQHTGLYKSHQPTGL